MADYKSLYEDSQKELAEVKLDLKRLTGAGEMACREHKNNREELIEFAKMKQEAIDELKEELSSARHDCRLKGGLLEEQADLMCEQLEENKKLKEENEGKKHRINELIQYKEMWKEENDKLKETLEKKDKQIERLVTHKKNREKQLIHIRAICENTDEYIEEKVCEKMDEYIVKKQNDKIDYLKHLLNEAEPFLSYVKDTDEFSVCADDAWKTKMDDLLIEIENI